MQFEINTTMKCYNLIYVHYISKMNSKYLRVEHTRRTFEQLHNVSSIWNYIKVTLSTQVNQDNREVADNVLIKRLRTFYWKCSTKTQHKLKLNPAEINVALDNVKYVTAFWRYGSTFTLDMKIFLLAYSELQTMPFSLDWFCPYSNWILPQTMHLENSLEGVPSKYI